MAILSTVIIYHSWASICYQIRSAKNIIITSAAVNIIDSQLQPRRSFWTVSNKYPYTWIIFQLIRRENIYLHRINIYRQTVIYTVFIFIKRFSHKKFHVGSLFNNHYCFINQSQMSIRYLFPHWYYLQQQ